MMINVNQKAKLNCIPHFHVLLIQNETQRRTQKGLLSFPLITLRRINTYNVRRMDKILAFTAKPNFARTQLTSRQKSDIQFLYIITRRYLQNLQVCGLSYILLFYLSGKSCALICHAMLLFTSPLDSFNLRKICMY